MAISFQNEDVQFNLPQKIKIRQWIRQIIRDSGNKSKIQINYIFCSDNYLLHINRTYLQHDTLTDIITFDNSDHDGKIEADVFISIERVEENSKRFRSPFLRELQRVMIHGVLHLIGFEDKTKDQREKMREKENECLTLYNP